MKTYTKLLPITLCLLALTPMAQAMQPTFVPLQATLTHTLNIDPATQQTIQTFMQAAQQAAHNSLQLAQQAAHATLQTAQGSSIRVLQVGLLSTAGLVGFGCCAWHLSKHLMADKPVPTEAEKTQWLSNYTKKTLIGCAGCIAGLTLILKAPAIISYFTR